MICPPDARDFAPLLLWTMQPSKTDVSPRLR